MKKSIILINSFGSGGAERMLSHVLKQLHSEGVDIPLVFLERLVFYELPDYIQSHFLSDSSPKKTSLLSKFFGIFITAHRLKSYVKQHRIEVVQSYLYRANFVNVLAKLLGSKHEAQLFNRSTVSRYLDAGFKGSVLIWLVRFFYPRADLLLSVSEGSLIDMQSYLSSQPPSKTIHNVYDIDYILDASKAPLDHESFSFDSSLKYFVCIARFIPLKRHKMLLRAFAEVCKTVDDWRLLLIGEGPDEQAIQAYCRELGIEDRVHFLGTLQNPYSVLSKCDCFLFSSSSEGFPNVLVEAMLCGLYVITTDCPNGPREILAPGTNCIDRVVDTIDVREFGTLVPVDHEALFVDAIQNYLSQYESLSQNASSREVYIRSFSNASYATYKRLLTQGKEAVR